MPWKNLQAVGQESNAFMQAAVQFVSERMLGSFAQQVRTAKRADEEEVSAKQCDRLERISLLIEENKAQVLGGMARCVERNESQHADFQRVAVAQRVSFHAVTIRLLVVEAERKLRANSFSKGERAGSEIRMDVCLGPRT